MVTCPVQGPPPLVLTLLANSDDFVPVSFPAVPDTCFGSRDDFSFLLRSHAVELVDILEFDGVDAFARDYLSPLEKHNAFSE